MSVLTATAVVWTLSTTISAQTLDQRISHLRQVQTTQQTTHSPATSATVARGSLQQILQQVVFVDVPAKKAFESWSAATRIPLLVNWQVLARAGVDTSLPVNLHLRQVPAVVVLELLMKQITPPGSLVGVSGGISGGLVYNVTPYYVEVTTKAYANQFSVVRLYPVMNLLMEVPNFTDAPPFDLQSALNSRSGSSGSTGGGGGGGGGNNEGLFGNQNQNNQQNTVGKSEAQRIASLESVIRNLVEPTAWRAAGGHVAFMQFQSGVLVVRAPGYMQRQIRGLVGPWVSLNSTPVVAATQPSGAGQSSAVSGAAARQPLNGGYGEGNGGGYGMYGPGIIASTQVSGVLDNVYEK